jgi:hypothetical protein
MALIQFLFLFTINYIVYLLGISRGKRFVAENIAKKIIMCRAEATKKQNIGGSADEHLRLDGEIRAYNYLLGFDAPPPAK